MNHAAICLKGVSRHFSTRLALQGIDLSISCGEAVALTGPNGSGKTTLLRIMATLLRPSSGKVFYFGEQNQNLCSLRKQIGALFVEGYLYSDLSVWENLSFYAKLFHLGNSSRMISEWLDRGGIRELANEPVRNLSRGERQKVALIRSLLHDPKILLWDEPTTGLDSKAKQLFSEISKERKGKQTIVCATHDPDSVSIWVDRHITLQNGKLT